MLGGAYVRRIGLDQAGPGIQRMCPRWWALDADYDSLLPIESCLIADTVARHRMIATMSKSLARVAASGVAAIDTLVAKQTDKESTVAEVVAVAK